MYISFFDRKYLSLELVLIVIKLTMSKGKTVFAQIMDIIPDYELKRCIDKYNGDKGTKKFTCRDQFKVMSFAQLTGRTSFRIIT